MSKEKILEAAFQAFSTGCYSSIALSEIAEKSKIKKPSIYAHFKSKEELFLEVLDNELSQLMKYIRSVIKEIENYDTGRVLQEFLIKSVKYVTDNEPVGEYWGNVLFVSQRDLKEEINIRTDKLRNYIHQEILQVMKRGMEKGDIRDQDLNSLVYSYLCLLQGNLLMTLKSKIFTIKNVSTSWSCFWQGIDAHNKS